MTRILFAIALNAGLPGLGNAAGLDAYSVGFGLGAPARQTPLGFGQMRILSRPWLAKRKFARPTLEPMVTSGPYRIESVDIGRAISYARVADYWGRDLPVNRGMNN